MAKNKKSGGKKESQGQDDAKVSKRESDTNGTNQGNKKKSIPKSNNSNAAQPTNRSQQQQKSQKQTKTKGKTSSSSSCSIFLGICLISLVVAGVGIYMSEDAQIIAGKVYSEHVEPIVVKARHHVEPLAVKARHHVEALVVKTKQLIDEYTKPLEADEQSDSPIPRRSKEQMEMDETERLDREFEENRRKKEEEEAKKRAEQERKNKEKKAEEERKRKERKEVEQKEKEKKEVEEKKRKERAEQEKKEAEEKKRKEKVEQEKKQAEEKKRKEKAEQEKKEAEEKKRKEKAEQEKKEAEEKKRKEKAEQEKKEAEEKKRKEKAEQEKKEAEETKRKEKVEQEKKEAEEKKRKEHEEEEKKVEQERKIKEKKEMEKRKEKEEADRKVNEKKETEERKRKDEADKKEKERKDEERKKKEREEADKKAEQERKTTQEKKISEERKVKEREEALKKANQEKKTTAEKQQKQKTQDKKEKENSNAATKKDGQENTSKEEPYEFASITNANDFKIRDLLDEADRLYEEEDYEEAVRKYDAILVHSHLSPRAMYGKGLTLDKLGFKHMSNEYLEEAINFLGRFLLVPDVPDELFLIGGRKLAEREHFRGWGSKAVKTFTLMLERFPEDIKLRCELGVTYMLIGRNNQAQDVFEQVLQFNPNSGFAKVHLGFIFKTRDNDLEKSIPLMREGLASGEEGTLDGRFYVQIGDALMRIGQEEEARYYFKAAESKGLFLSEWQRSLYNVDELTARPFWTAKQLGYEKYINLLEKNWETIRDEGLAQLNGDSGSFVPEEENLRDTGEWQQFTLYQQGRKNTDKCAKVPKTCAIIDQIPEVKNCRRGQVKFSVMSPGIHVWPHTGPTNCRLRSHLGLVTPDGPVLRVKNETRTWTEGKVITFDDSFEHEVWHKGTKPRLILIVDFWHPELTEKQKKTLSSI